MSSQTIAGAARCCCYGSSSSYAPAAYTDAVKQNAGAALDVILIEQSDGSLKSTDWLCVFEQLAHPCDVHIHVNGREVSRRLRATAPHQPAIFDEAGCAPAADMLADLVTWPELQTGKNELRYTVVESGQTVRTWLYLWKKQCRVIIFDVDGTVTLSDVVGHMGGMLDQSFVHQGGEALKPSSYALLPHTACFRQSMLRGCDSVTRTGPGYTAYGRVLTLVCDVW